MATNSKLKQAKICIRKAIKQRIHSEYDEKRLHFESEFVVNNVTKSLKYKSAKSIALFVSMQNGEIKTDSLIKDCFEQKKKVYLPRIIGDKMDKMIFLQTFCFEEIYDDEYFTKSKWGIFEPKICKKRENAMNAMDLDFMIIPGVAFNAQNHRLGHGKGHYDRFLNEYKMKNNKKLPHLVGIGLAANYHKDIPLEKHDNTLDEVFLFNAH